MKKFALLLMSVVLFASCDMDDDGVQRATVLTAVASADFPEYFENGETVKIDVTYLLPDTCHTPLGIDVRRGKDTGEERRDIYIYGVASYEVNRTNCPGEGEDIEKSAFFNIKIDEEEPYTFYLWTGEVDTDDEPIFDVYEIPVGEPVDEGGEGEGEE